MSLKITLKPHERMIIAGAAFINGNTTASLIIENRVAILREKDILREPDANSPAQKIYFIVQMMYLDHDSLSDHHKVYWDHVRAFAKAVPSALGLIEEICKHILGAHYYKALKSARKLIDYEQLLISKIGRGDSPCAVNRMRDAG